MLGVIARCDDRGLGVMTLDLVRHLRPDRVLVLDVPESPIPGRPERYMGLAGEVMHARWSPARPGLPPSLVARFLDGLTTVYSAETFYDPAIPQEATKRDVRAVLHVMPEFARHWSGALVEEWLPTPWRREHHPGAPIVPVPVPSPPFYVDEPGDSRGRPLRVVHVAGNIAAGDRNGTDVFVRALAKLSPDARVHATIAVQRGAAPAVRGTPRGVSVALRGPAADRWDLYAGADVLVMPRRYGGLCLPVQEAMALGLAVVMPDVSPNEWYTALRVPVPSTAGRLKTPAGMIPMAEPDETAIARLLEHLADVPEELRAARYAARSWAADHSWAALEHVYREMLGA